jgi:hypothetical protein
MSALTQTTAARRRIATVGIDQVALYVLAIAVLLVVLISAARPSPLVPSSAAGGFPGWMAGPFKGVVSGLPRRDASLDYITSLLIGVMFLAYLVLLRSSARLSAKAVLGTIAVVNAVLFLGPPLFSTDVFSYLEYGRLGALHGLDPYTNVPVAGPHTDAAYEFISWYRLRSPYGPLFTVLTDILAHVPLSAGFWILKTILLCSTAGLLALIWRAAHLLGRSPVVAIVVVGLNPLVLLWMVGAQHNDALMLVFVVLAIVLALEQRRAPPERGRLLAVGAGAAILVAGAIKPPALLVLPFIALGARPAWVLLGALFAAACTAIVALAVVGRSLSSPMRRFVFEFSERRPPSCRLAC